MKIPYKRKIIHKIDKFGTRYSSFLKNNILLRRNKYHKLYDILVLPFDFFSVLFSYRDVFGKFPKILRPVTFSEHIQHNKLFDRKSIYTLCADKVSVREFVKQKIGEKYLPKLLWSGKEPFFTLDVFSALPNRFVIKANHGSGSVKIVENKKNINFSELKKEVQDWVNIDFSQKHKEWQYRWIEPLLLVEEFLESCDSRVPDDYKFYCINGEVAFCNVHLSRFTSHKSFFVDRELRILPISRNKLFISDSKCEGLINKQDFLELIEISKKLSQDFRFVRVDLYHVNKPYFGELTFSPAAGLRKFYPDGFDLLLGKMLRNEALVEDIYKLNIDEMDK